VAPPGNQAANGENKRQPAATGVLGLLDKYLSKKKVAERGWAEREGYLLSACCTFFCGKSGKQNGEAWDVLCNFDGNLAQ
jgi:hypothetical protein